MATRTISTRIAVEGESKFKQEITACNSKLTLLKSSLAATESEFRKQANSLDALNAKDEQLNKIKNEQTDKINKLKAALENCRSAVSKYTEQHTDLEAKIKASDQAISELDAASQKAGKQWANYAEQLQKSKFPAGSLASVEKTTREGHVLLSFGLPAGAQGPRGFSGSSIQKIERTNGNGAAGTVDTYTITLTDGSTTTFQVYNGADGTGSGDMSKSVYDPQNKNDDAG